MYKVPKLVLVFCLFSPALFLGCQMVSALTISSYVGVSVDEQYDYTVSFNVYKPIQFSTSFDLTIRVTNYTADTSSSTIGIDLYSINATANLTTDCNIIVGKDDTTTTDALSHGNVAHIVGLGGVSDLYMAAGYLLINKNIANKSFNNYDIVSGTGDWMNATWENDNGVLKRFNLYVISGSESYTVTIARKDPFMWIILGIILAVGVIVTLLAVRARKKAPTPQTESMV